MKTIQATAKFKIKVNELEAFKALAAKFMKSTQEKDTGTTQYDWFINEPKMECVVRETFINSDAVLEHVGNLGGLMAEILSLCDMNLEVYGNPSPKLLAATEGLHPKIYSFMQGLK